MRLTISERMGVLNILPPQGNMATLRIVRELQSKLSLSEEEYTQYNVSQKIDQSGKIWIEWNPEYDKKRVNIPISKVESDIISQALMKLDQNSQLQLGALPLWDYFVDNKEPQEV